MDYSFENLGSDLSIDNCFLILRGRATGDFAVISENLDIDDFTGTLDCIRRIALGESFGRFDFWGR